MKIRRKVGLLVSKRTEQYLDAEAGRCFYMGMFPGHDRNVQIAIMTVLQLFSVTFCMQ